MKSIIMDIVGSSLALMEFNSACWMDMPGGGQTEEIDGSAAMRDGVK